METKTKTKIERTLAEIEKEIARTKMELNDVHGTETEVYARIVGYYRAVKHWNKGKRDEYNQRKLFTWENDTNSQNYEITAADTTCDCSQTGIQAAEILNTNSNIKNEISDLTSVSYEMYTRKTCPNCPPVKDFMSGVSMSGRTIDVDTKEGLSEAAKNGVFASPTVIFYNEAGIETARCHNVEELEAVFDNIKVNA